MIAALASPRIAVATSIVVGALLLRYSGTKQGARTSFPFLSLPVWRPLVYNLNGTRKTRSERLSYPLFAPLEQRAYLTNPVACVSRLSRETNLCECWKHRPS